MIVDPFIAIEWGTAHLRARLLTANGGVVDEVTEDVRLADLDHAAMLSWLRRFRLRWAHAADTIWLTGMIGSQLGLVNVPHLPCSIAPADIARGAKHLELEGLSLAILPGLSCTSAFGDHDVLRGEELAAAAVIRPGRLGGAMLLSVPGMHGKWIELSETRIESFHTSMTVELFRLLADRSILAPLTKTVPSNNDAFQRGVTRAAEGGGIGRLLFSARSAVLAGTMREADAASYIWGVLIGADIRENLPRIRSGELACLVTGADDVAPLFCAALETMGGKAELLDNRRLSAVGFARLRQAADLARVTS